jgi:hypothetical protein
MRQASRDASADAAAVQGVTGAYQNQTWAKNAEARDAYRRMQNGGVDTRGPNGWSNRERLRSASPGDFEADRWISGSIAPTGDSYDVAGDGAQWR